MLAIEPSPPPRQCSVLKQRSWINVSPTLLEDIYPEQQRPRLRSSHLNCGIPPLHKVPCNSRSYNSQTYSYLLHLVEAPLLSNFISVWLQCCETHTEHAFEGRGSTLELVETLLEYKLGTLSPFCIPSPPI